MGFLASASGEAYFEDIKNYFRNIATWLAPIEKQRCMRNRWLWNIIRQPSFNEDFGVQLLKSKKLTIRESAELGRHILAYPSLNLSKCQVRRWLLDLMIPELIIEMPDIACLLDPCIPNPNPGPDPLPFIDQEVLLEAAIGDLAVSMFAESSKLEETKSLKGPDTKKLDKMANSSGKSVLKLMGKELGLASKKFSKVASQLKGL